MSINPEAIFGLSFLHLLQNHLRVDEHPRTYQQACVSIHETAGNLAKTVSHSLKNYGMSCIGSDPRASNDIRLIVQC